LQRKQGKGWELPNFSPLTWNDSRFERAAECPQHSEKKRFGLGEVTSFLEKDFLCSRTHFFDSQEMVARLH
jgi:hypothetical protein